MLLDDPSDLLWTLSFYLADVKRCPSGEVFVFLNEDGVVPFLSSALHCAACHDAGCHVQAVSHLVGYVIACKESASFRIDELPLPVIDSVIFEDILSGGKVVVLDLLLCLLHCLAEDSALDGLVFLVSALLEGLPYPVAAVEPHDVVLGRKVEYRLAGIPLSSGSSSQLVVDAHRLVAFRADDHEPAGLSCLVVKDDVCASSCDVRCDRDGSVLSCLCDDVGFRLVLLCVQHLVVDAFPVKHCADSLACPY